MFFNNIYFYILHIWGYNFKSNNTYPLFLRYSYYAFRAIIFVFVINLRSSTFKQKHYFNRYSMHITKWHIDDKTREWHLVLFS